MSKLKIQIKFKETHKKEILEFRHLILVWHLNFGI